MSFLHGKKALILGVANERSIAWAIAKKFKSQGASLAMTYLNDALKKRVVPLAREADADFVCEMDVTRDDHFDSLKKTVEQKWGHFDILVHSLAFADREDLKGSFTQTSRKGFLLAMDISAYSLVGLCQHLHPLMNEEASVIAMTYHGSTKVVKNYDVMGVAKAALETSMMYLADDLGPKGIRVNCISAGPIKTLAASGIGGFRRILETVEERSPLRRNISADDVSSTALFLASYDLSKNITGQTLYVDSGFSTLGI
ncbi:MAG: enoyl-ACP reductase [Bacteriovoracales bacterium]|nr:enoyl-ACP reductase [Bacteriovoracales bacterium]